MNKPTVYVESSVVSYYTARPSRDVIVLAHQELTRIWWNECLSKYDARVSQIVLEEITRGDSEAAERRREAVSHLALLSVNEQVEELSAIYLDELGVPERALRDTLHIALASVHEMDYLLTWNCAHIANAQIRGRLAELNRREMVSIPIICTPEELLDD